VGSVKIKVLNNFKKELFLGILFKTLRIFIQVGHFSRGLNLTLNRFKLGYNNIKTIIEIETDTFHHIIGYFQ
jgi:hypothetical protein